MDNDLLTGGVQLRVAALGSDVAGAGRQLLGLLGASALLTAARYVSTLSSTFPGWSRM